MKKDGFLKKYSTAIPYVVIVVVIVGVFLYAFYRDYEGRPQSLRNDQITELSKKLQKEYGVTDFMITYNYTLLDIHLKGSSLPDNDRQEILCQISSLVLSDRFQGYFEKKPPGDIEVSGPSA